MVRTRSGKRRAADAGAFDDDADVEWLTRDRRKERRDASASGWKPGAHQRTQPLPSSSATGTDSATSASGIAASAESERVSGASSGAARTTSGGASSGASSASAAIAAALTEWMRDGGAAELVETTLDAMRADMRDIVDAFVERSAESGETGGRDVDGGGGAKRAPSSSSDSRTGGLSGATTTTTTTTTTTRHTVESERARGVHRRRRHQAAEAQDCGDAPSDDGVESLSSDSGDSDGEDDDDEASTGTDDSAYDDGGDSDEGTRRVSNAQLMHALLATMTRAHLFALLKFLLRYIDAAGHSDLLFFVVSSMGRHEWAALFETVYAQGFDPVDADGEHAAPHRT